MVIGVFGVGYGFFGGVVVYVLMVCDGLRYNCGLLCGCSVLFMCFNLTALLAFVFGGVFPPHPFWVGGSPCVPAVNVSGRVLPLPPVELAGNKLFCFLGGRTKLLFLPLGIGAPTVVDPPFVPLCVGGG